MCRARLSNGNQDMAGRVAGSAGKSAVSEQLAKQLEPLLFLAYQLQLEQLQNLMLCVIRGHADIDNSLLRAAVKLLASDRVVSAMGQSKAAAVDSLLMQPLVFSGQQRLLKPINLKAAQQRPLEFQAEVMQDFLNFKKGGTVGVSVDLFDQVVSLTAGGIFVTDCPLHLLLGLPFADKE